jgi:hypothetical protein
VLVAKGENEISVNTLDDVVGFAVAVVKTLKIAAR